MLFGLPRKLSCAMALVGEFHSADTPSPLAKRGLDGPSPPSSKKQRNPKHLDLSVGMWVTIKAASRRKVDCAKAETPCLVTRVQDSRATVLYPNMLSVFLNKQSDGTVTVKFSTEECDLALIRAYDGDVTSLDRKLRLNLCQAIARAEKPCCPERVPGSVEPCEGLRGEAWMTEFTVSVSRAFQALGREIFDKKALHAVLLANYSSIEIDDGLKALDKSNKVMMADDAVFLI